MRVDGTEPTIVTRWVFMVTFGLVVYFVGYGLCRWQDVLIYTPHLFNTERDGNVSNLNMTWSVLPCYEKLQLYTSMTSISGKNDDMRSFLAEPVYFIYRPLATIESRLRQ